MTNDVQTAGEDRQPKTMRLSASTRANLAALVASGYAKDATAVVEKAVAQAAGTPVPLPVARLDVSTPAPKARKPAIAAKPVAPANVAPPATPPQPAPLERALHPNDTGSLAGRRAGAQPFSRETQGHR